MEVFREEWDKIKTAYEVAGRLMPSWERMKPVALQLRELVRTSLTQHPDLSSIALLLVIFYISFVFLVKTWRMAIGSIRFASKAVLMVLLIVFTYGCFEAAVNEEAPTFDMMIKTGKFGLNLASDLLQGSRASDGPATGQAPKKSSYWY